jgi:hypothetical protein
LLDAVTFAVLREPFFDTVGKPGERKLTQRRKVARPEVVRQRGVDALRWIDVTPCEPIP